MTGGQTTKGVETFWLEPIGLVSDKIVLLDLSQWRAVGETFVNTWFLSEKELCRISLAQLYPTTSWCNSQEDLGNFGRSSVCIGSINERESSLFASYGAFCTGWKEVIVLIDYEKIRLVNYVTICQRRVRGDQSIHHTATFEIVVCTYVIHWFLIYWHCHSDPFL